jgi:hypothetical protein
MEVVMAATAGVKRPRVIGIVILSLIGAFFGLLGGVGLLGLIAAAQAEGTTVPSWITLTAYVTIALAVIAFLAAILMLMYKRLGLYLGALCYGISLILTILQVVGGQSTISASVIIGVLIDLVVLYYIYIYLTREPEKSFFT